MNRLFIATIVLAGTFHAQADDLLPSDVMRKIPSIPESVAARDCDAAQSLLANAEQQVMADMMRSRQMAMAGGRSGSISDKQGELIEKLLAPENTACDANVFMKHDGQDIAGELRQDLAAIRMQTRSKIEKKCPVIGAGGYRAEPCVKPILHYGTRRESATLTAFIKRANRALSDEKNAYAQCAARHEQLAEDAEAAQLPPQYAGLAFGNKAKAWRNVARLATRYRRLCSAAADAAAYLANPDRAW